MVGFSPLLKFEARKLHRLHRFVQLVQIEPWRLMSWMLKGPVVLVRIVALVVATWITCC